MSSVLWTALSLNSKLEQFAQRVSVPQLERCNLQAAASQQASGSSDATADSDAAVTDYYSAADTTVGTGSVADDASSTGSHAASASASGSSGNTDDDKQAVVGTVLSWGQAPVSTGSLVSTNLNTVTLQTHWHFPRTTPLQDTYYSTSTTGSAATSVLDVTQTLQSSAPGAGAAPTSESTTTSSNSSKGSAAAAGPIVGGVVAVVAVVAFVVLATVMYRRRRRANHRDGGVGSNGSASVTRSKTLAGSRFYATAVASPATPHPSTSTATTATASLWENGVTAESETARFMPVVTPMITVWDSNVRTYELPVAVPSSAASDASGCELPVERHHGKVKGKGNLTPAGAAAVEAMMFKPTHTRR